MPPTVNDPRFNFEANPTLEELLEQQGKGPVSDLSIFQGGWPDDEPIEDFLAALREWRGQRDGERIFISSRSQSGRHFPSTWRPAPAPDGR